MIQGTVMIFVGPDGRVVAEATDFARDRPGGFTVAEAQRLRCTRALHAAVFTAFASPVLVEATDEYGRAQVISKLEQSGYRKHLIQVEAGA